jgi:nitroreductase
MIDAIKKRRAIREYLSDSVSEDQLSEILSAAFYAPSANAKYPWDLVVVRDEEARDRLSKITPWSSHIKDAPVSIAIVAHEADSVDWIEDCSVVAGHMWLEATNQGLGACWVQVRGNDNAEKETAEILNLPAGNRVFCLLSVGKPAKEELPHDETDFDKKKIKQEKY